MNTYNYQVDTASATQVGQVRAPSKIQAVRILHNEFGPVTVRVSAAAW